MSEKRIHIFREVIIVLVLSLVLVSTFNIKAVKAQAGQKTLKPSDDTYVDSSNPNSNYGGQTYLEVENSTFGSPPYQSIYQDIVWLKFDLSTVPNGAVIDGATLSLYTFFVGETFNVTACYCSENSWTELGITWNNYPRTGFISVDSLSVATSDKWYNWTVFDAVKYSQDNNLTAVTIALIEPNVHSSPTVVEFYSKESPVYFTDYSPTLTVHWSSVVPEFPTFIPLSLFMMMTLIAATYYRFKQKLPVKGIES